MGNGEIITEYEEDYENMPEVITHKHVLDEYNAKARAAKSSQLGEIMTEEGDESNDDDQEELTTDQRKGNYLFFRSIILIVI